MGIWARVERGPRRCALAALAVAMGLTTAPVLGESNGIAGYSGNPDANHGGGTTCSSCHSGGSYSISTTIGGDATVAPGQTSIPYTISATGSATRFGFNLSTNSGTLGANSAT
ncbi:MAG: choice-of-anchor V domain-containing protein, partial [Panacagrimonas sp.]